MAEIFSLKVLVKESEVRGREVEELTAVVKDLKAKVKEGVEREATLSGEDIHALSLLILVDCDPQICLLLQLIVSAS